MYNVEMNDDDLIFMVVGLPIIVVVIGFIIFCIITSIDRSSRLDKVKNAIEQEIKFFLFNKDDVNYIFKNSNLEQQMKSEIQTAIIDLRHNRYTLSNSYLHRSENKIKQIYRIINRYYKLDKKNILEINNNVETNDDIILIENKEINND